MDLKLRRAYIVLLTLPAYLLWFFTFRIPVWTFWHRMVLSTSGLFIISIYFRREIFENTKLSDISSRLCKGLIGVIHGLLAYVFVYAGFKLLKEYIILDAAQVYNLRYDLDIDMISVILVFTSICEEVYWRGFIQHNLQKSMNQYLAILMTSFLYSTIHIWTLNTSLIMIAFIMGFLWGFLYNKTRSIISPISSHILWDELIFVYLPLINNY